VQNVNLPHKAGNQIMDEECKQGAAAGKVVMVGAGPGDPELITVKGRAYLEACDCVLYDALLDPVMLEWTRPDCERVCVGKRSGNHSLDQVHINCLLLEKARGGRLVVRLKGGDPFIFGRGGEELAALREAGVEVEVVPGVTAAVAAAAALQQPLTHRDHASVLVLATGHEDPLKEREGVDWRLFGSSDATVVLYMGMKHLASIARQMMDAGRSADTPVAVVEWVSTARERHLFSRLGSVAADCMRQNIQAPSVVWIGEVLASSLSPLVFPNPSSAGSPLVPPQAESRG
jgi:uroporphyrinogen III methyltransferase/synthase